MSDTHHASRFSGPKCWVATALVGLLVGGVLSQFVDPYPDHASNSSSDVTTATHSEDASATDLIDEPHGETIRLAGVDDGGDIEELPAMHKSEPAETQHGSSEAAEHGTPEASHGSEHGQSPVIALWMVIPFAMLLGSIALMPFISERFWHNHFPDFAFFLGGIMVAFYLLAFGRDYTHGLSYGQYQMMHAGLEYYAFMALVGGLFVASGGVLIEVKGKGGPWINTAILAFGAVLANIVGTTGASVLLIQPFMRVNKGRLRPIHIVMFIFIVSNCGGSLTPIGDPPLYLGFLKGVPFQWTLLHLWPMWATAIGLLLAMFFFIDWKIGPAKGLDLAQQTRTSVRIKGTSGLIALALIIAGVFIDPFLKSQGMTWAEGKPIGATFQIAVAIGAYMLASREIQKANDFSFFPVKEVGLLFAGIFATMAPALGFLSTHGSQLGLNTPTRLYFGTGALSGVLDNAPTYLNFLQVALAGHEPPLPMDSAGIHEFISTPLGVHELAAISLGAVFFGAMTYIGNGPNFMIRAIATAGGVKMPSFFGYAARAVVLLLPVLIVVWFTFIR